MATSVIKVNLSVHCHHPDMTLAGARTETSNNQSTHIKCTWKSAQVQWPLTAGHVGCSLLIGRRLPTSTPHVLPSPAPRYVVMVTAPRV